MVDWKAGRFAPPVPPAFAIRRAGCIDTLAHRLCLGVDRGAAHGQPEVGRSVAETPGVMFRGDPCSVAARRRWVSGPLRKVASSSLGTGFDAWRSCCDINQIAAQELPAGLLRCGQHGITAGRGVKNHVARVSDCLDQR